MDKIPLISINMPLYKTPPIYLKNAVESLLNQISFLKADDDVTNFELILVNDSPDDEQLKQSIKAFQDPRIRIIENQTNQGISRSHNTAIDAARGEFIAIMDHDDISLPMRFARQVHFFRQHPEIGFLSAQAEGFYDDGEITPLRYETSLDPQVQKAKFFDAAPYMHPCTMYRRSALGDLRYDPEFKICPDLNMFARLLFDKGVLGTNLPDVLIWYRLHNNNTSLVGYELGEKETEIIRQRCTKFEAK